jgi:hypothetical protein
MPHKSLEIGGSLTSITGRNESADMILAGADIQVWVDSFEIKGEYIAHPFDTNEGDDFTNDGYYLQALYGRGDWYLVGRYGEFRPDQGHADIARVSAGIGRSIKEVVEFRVEYQANDAADDAAVFQAAFRF